MDETQQKPKIIVAVNAFVVRDDKILLGKRKGAVGAGFWGVPGGKLNFFESLVDCAKRELFEETGLVANQLTFLHMVNDPRGEDNSHCIHIGFLAEDVVGEPETKEPEKCEGWQWFPLDNLPEIFLGHRRLIPTIKNGEIIVDMYNVLLTKDMVQ